MNITDLIGNPDNKPARITQAQWDELVATVECIHNTIHGIVGGGEEEWPLTDQPEEGEA